VERKFATLRLAYTDAITEQHSAALELTAAMRLAADQERLATIAARELGKSAKETAPSDRARQRTLVQMEAYLDGASQEAWAKYTTPLLRAAAEDALVATVVPDLGLDAALLRPHVGAYIQRESAFLITNVTDTTKQAVRDALARTIDDGIDATVRAIREDTAFGRARARLIGRTETTRVLNGAPLEALQQYGATTDQTFTKSWLATLDDRVRDEHEAMHGETVPIDKQFSNGLDAPGEPNCRCGLTYGVEGVSQ
jgi:SPP1 gp7 family putative phage head morphogenesis protein